MLCCCRYCCCRTVVIINHLHLIAMMPHHWHQEVLEHVLCIVFFLKFLVDCLLMEGVVEGREMLMSVTLSCTYLALNCCLIGKEEKNTKRAAEKIPIGRDIFFLQFVSLLTCFKCQTTCRVSNASRKNTTTSKQQIVEKMDHIYQ